MHETGGNKEPPAHGLLKYRKKVQTAKEKSKKVNETDKGTYFEITDNALRDRYISN